MTAIRTIVYPTSSHLHPNSSPSLRHIRPIFIQILPTTTTPLSLLYYTSTPPPSHLCSTSIPTPSHFHSTSMNLISYPFCLQPISIQLLHTFTPPQSHFYCPHPSPFSPPSSRYPTPIELHPTPIPTPFVSTNLYPNSIASLSPLHLFFLLHQYHL
jgi:hypothetical protein